LAEDESHSQHNDDADARNTCVRFAFRMLSAASVLCHFIGLSEQSSFVVRILSAHYFERNCSSGTVIFFTSAMFLILQQIDAAVRDIDGPWYGRHYEIPTALHFFMSLEGDRDRDNKHHCQSVCETCFSTELPAAVGDSFHRAV